MKPTVEAPLRFSNCGCGHCPPGTWSPIKPSLLIESINQAVEDDIKTLLQRKLVTSLVATGSSSGN